MTIPRDYVLLIDWNYSGSLWVRLSNGVYCTWPDDTPADTEYLTRIRSMPYSLSATDVLHREGSGAPLTRLILSNADGALNFLRAVAVRGTALTVSAVAPGAAYSTRQLVARCYANRFVSQDAAGRLELSLDTAAHVLRGGPGGAGWPSGTPNAQIVNQPRPVVLGTVEYVEGVVYDQTENIVAVTDREWWGPTNVYQRGVLATDGLDFRRTVVPSSYVHGLDFASDITGRLGIGVRGSIRLGDQVIVDSELENWTGDTLDDWTTVQSPPNSRTEQAGAVLYSDGADLSISQTVLTIGAKYHAWINITVVQGGLELRCGGVTVAAINRTGWNYASFVAAGTDFTLRAATGTYPDIAVNLGWARCYEATETNRIGALARHLIIDRVGNDAVTVHDASLDALETAAPYDLGAAIDDSMRIDERLQLACDALCAVWWVDLLGNVRFGRLRDPAGETPARAITIEQVSGGIRVRQDDAPGLSRTLRYGINYSVHAPADVDAAVDPTTRAALQSSERTVYTGNPVSQHYALSADQKGRQTWLRTEAHAQAQLDHECALYEADGPADFYEFEVIGPPDDQLSMQPFDCISLVYDRKPLNISTARKLVTFAIGGDLCKLATAQILAWRPTTDE